MDLREHLAAPLDEGGHAMEGYLLDVSIHQSAHEDDHNPDGWWAPCITHSHKEG